MTQFMCLYKCNAS